MIDSNSLVKEIEEKKKELELLKSKTQSKCMSCANLTCSTSILPCGCKVCLDCENNFCVSLLNQVSFDKTFNKEMMTCLICKYNYKINELIKYACGNETESTMKQNIKMMISHIFNNYCMECLKENEGEKFKQICVKEDTICKLFDVRNLHHVVCDKCSKAKSSQCKICDCYHFTIVPSKII